MNEAMEAMARALGKPICPDCKCELVYPGNTCSQCDRPPEGMGGGRGMSPTEKPCVRKIDQTTCGYPESEHTDKFDHKYEAPQKIEPILCMHCNLPLSRHAPKLHPDGGRNCPDGYHWSSASYYTPKSVKREAGL
jgi:hypothetical protein